MLQTTKLLRFQLDRSIELSGQPHGNYQQRNRNPLQTPRSRLGRGNPAQEGKRIQLLRKYRDDGLRDEKEGGQRTSHCQNEGTPVRRKFVGRSRKGLTYSTGPTLSTTTAQGPNKLEATARTDSHVSTSK